MKTNVIIVGLALAISSLFATELPERNSNAAGKNATPEDKVKILAIIQQMRLDREKHTERRNALMEQLKRAQTDAERKALQARLDAEAAAYRLQWEERRKVSDDLVSQHFHK